jgi:ribosomal protein L7/L12
MHPALFFSCKEFKMADLSTYQEEQIRELVNQDKKIAAVKLYREYTGASLKKATDEVEKIATGTPTQFPDPPQTLEPDSVLKNQIERLLTERKKIEAVKVYREATNCGLKEAKDEVEHIQAEMRREGYSSIPSAPAVSADPFAEDSQRNQRFLAILIAIVLLVIGGVAFFLLAGNGF